MMLVIQTQDYENYAAHEGFQGEHRWKAKGGSEYKVTGVPACDPAEIIELVRSEIEQNNDYFQTQIIGWRLESDDYLSEFEQSQLSYEGEIRYRELEIDYADLVDTRAA